MKFITILITINFIIYFSPEKVVAQWNILPVLDVSQQAYNDVTFTDINTIYIGGRGAGLSDAFILKSTDAGTTWTPASFPSGMQIYEVTRIFFPPSGASLAGYAVASVINEGYKLFRTTDGGLNWTLISIPQYQFGFDIRDIYFFDIDNGLFTVRYGTPPQISIFKTTNAGSSWTEVTAPAEIANVTFITSISSSEFFVAASDSFQKAVMLHTMNGGNSWEKVQTGAYNIIKPIYYGGDIYATGNDTAIFSNDAIVKGTNTGGNWSWDSLYTLQGFSEDIDIATQNIYASSNFWNGIANVGNFYRSGDLGISWQNFGLPNENHINEMTFVTESTGYSVGDSAFQKPLFFKTTNGGGLVGIRQIESNEVHNYHLNQNYPNPFNSSTTIEFQMPKSQFVTLKIYNILGQEIKTLVSQTLPVGNYEYNWDAGDLSSGLYYYQLKTDDFNQVRKMILMK